MLFRVVVLAIALVVPPRPSASWQMRGISFRDMKETLITWQTTYEENTVDWNNTLEMIAWQRTATGKHGTIALFHNQEVRALAQVRETRMLGETIYKLRSVCTPSSEDVAGTILMYKVFQHNITVDWQQMRRNPRWYVAAIFLRGEYLS